MKNINSAWKDEAQHQSLSASRQVMPSVSPSGEVELTDQALEAISGALDTSNPGIFVNPFWNPQNHLVGLPGGGTAQNGIDRTSSSNAPGGLAVPGSSTAPGSSIGSSTSTPGSSTTIPGNSIVPGNFPNLLVRIP